MANPGGSSSDELPCSLPSWCRPKGVKTTLSKTGCPVLDELAERIHQSGSCSGHQSPRQQKQLQRGSGSGSGSLPRAALANAAARVASSGGQPAAVASSGRSQPPPPAPLSRSRSFPAAADGRLPQAGSSSSADVDLDQVGDGCSAEAVRQAADGVTADDPDFKETVPYLTTVSDGLKQECLKQLIALKQKLLREFAEVLCLIERKYTLKYAESLSEAREQQTVARYYQMAYEKNRKIVEKMAAALYQRRLRCLLRRCFSAWHRAARQARSGKNGEQPDEPDGQAGGDSDCIDIEYTRTEEIGTKVYERKLTAQLTKALERDARAQECRKYHTGPPCPGKVCRCKRQAERQRYRRIEQLECELELAKRREQQLMEQKHLAETKYRQAVLRGMSVMKEGGLGDTPTPSECAPTKTTTICRRRVDSSDSTLPPARIRRSQSETRRGSPRAGGVGGGAARGCRRRTRSRAPPACRATQTRHLSCVAPLPPQAWQRNAECVTSKTQRRPRVKVCAERQGPRRAVLVEARSRAAAASAADALDGISDSSITVTNYNEPSRKMEVTEKWRHLSRN
ncbi:hypothetical protein FJT64_007505 [Amphibalanus amphitrite]|uniref:Uncharacterized protein n=2 Tax=Amphibalanus amphitrite TaxID=1232801 RepID=A0A6A4VZE7_AMPAM|nr:hypothetical protein FJT64_007505 [Amphibalanus amphitrite]